MYTNIVSPTKLADILNCTIPHRLPVLITSAPGLGKSDIIRQAAQRNDYECIVLHPVTLDPIDISGTPLPVDGGSGVRRMERVLDDFLDPLFDTEKRIVLLIDELGQASPMMQAACAPVILDRRVGKRTLGKNVVVCAATNASEHRASANNILSHIISRMSTVLQLQTNIDDWSKWAITNDIREEVISFLRFRPAKLHEFDADTVVDHTTAYPCPRSWCSLSKLLDSGVPSECEQAVFSGTIGPSTAMEFYTYLQSNRKAPDLDKILAGEISFRVPEKASDKWAVATGIALRCNKDTRSKVLDIIQTLHDNHSSEFAMAAIRDALSIDTELASSAVGSRFLRESPVVRNLATLGEL